MIRIEILAALLGACHHDPETFPDRPAGLGDPCTADEDCQEGQLCVLSDIDTSYVDTCQVPCSDGPVECLDYSGWCSYCDDAVDPPACRLVGCSR